MGGFNTVSSGGAYSIPNDDTLRTYRFYYLPDTGYGALLVDGVEVWSNDGPDYRPMYWYGAGDITIGRDMDASGANKTSLDNMIIRNVTYSPLPIELTSFKGYETQQGIELVWETKSELNNDYFVLAKSIDGNKWQQLTTIKGVGTSSRTNNYSFLDASPNLGIDYYRLSQVDFDGKSEVFDPIAVEVKYNKSELTIFPNPTDNSLKVYADQYLTGSSLSVYNSLGQKITNIITTDLDDRTVEIDVNTFENGIYFIRSTTGVSTRFVKVD